MNILFISEMPPIDTKASSVVFYRHFIKLKNEGHSIHILIDTNSFNAKEKAIPSEFRTHLLPNRKWYYPPYKSYGPLQRFRFFDYYQFHAKKIIADHSIDIIVGFVYHDFLSPFSAYVKAKSNLPLVTFFHDDTLELNVQKLNKHLYRNTSKVLEASDKILVASSGFENNWQKFKDKFELLFPIPTEVSETSTDRNNNNITICYSGTVYNEVINSLEKIADITAELNIDFKIINNNSKVNYLNQKYSTEVLPLFDTAEEANIYLKRNCSAFVITYPEDISEMPWIKSCFPSKFIQYCQLEIPTIIIAPIDSAIGIWCKKNNWILYSQTYTLTSFNDLLNKTKTIEVAHQVKHFKTNDFNVVKIHEKFKHELEKVKSCHY